MDLHRHRSASGWLSVGLATLVLSGCGYHDERTELSDRAIASPEGLTFYREHATGWVTRQMHGSPRFHAWSREVEVWRLPYDTDAARRIATFDGEDVLRSDVMGHDGYVLRDREPLLRSRLTSPHSGCLGWQLETGIDAYWCEGTALVQDEPDVAPFKVEPAQWEAGLRQLGATGDYPFQAKFAHATTEPALIVYDDNGGREPLADGTNGTLVAVFRRGTAPQWFNSGLTDLIGPHEPGAGFHFIAVDLVDGVPHYLRTNLDGEYQVHAQSRPSGAKEIARFRLDPGQGRLLAFLPARGEAYFVKPDFSARGRTPTDVLRIDYRTGARTTVTVP